MADTLSGPAYFLMMFVIFFLSIYWFVAGAVVFHSLQRKTSFQKRAAKLAKFKVSYKLNLSKMLVFSGCVIDIVVYESLDYSYFWFGYFIISYIIAESLSFMEFREYRQLYECLENEELLSAEGSENYERFKNDYLSNNPFNFLYEGLLLILVGFVGFWMYEKFVMYQHITK